MLEIKKHMKKILAISAASLVGVMTVVSSILPYDSAYAEGTGSTSVLKVTVDGDGSVSVNTGSREYTATEKKAFEKTFEQGAKVTIAAGDGKMRLNLFLKMGKRQLRTTSGIIADLISQQRIQIQH